MKPSIDADKSGSVFVFYPFRRTEKGVVSNVLFRHNPVVSVVMDSVI